MPSLECSPAGRTDRMPLQYQKPRLPLPGSILPVTRNVIIPQTPSSTYHSYQSSSLRLRLSRIRPPWPPTTHNPPRKPNKRPTTRSKTSNSTPPPTPTRPYQATQPPHKPNTATPTANNPPHTQAMAATEPQAVPWAEEPRVSARRVEGWESKAG